MQDDANHPASVLHTSSRPLQLESTQLALYHHVLTLFEESHYPYAVAGAFALRQHTGICRFTKDLDIFVTAETATQALCTLQEADFELEVCDPVWLAKVHQGEYFVDLITGMSNGVITVDNTWIERAQPAKVCGVDSRVLAPEEMIASKLFVTRRERFDGADIAHIIHGTRGRLDWQRILHLAGEHWEIVFWALLLFRYVYPEQQNYVPQSVWRDLIDRFENVLQSAARGEFRGSLIDDVMFAIDVEEWGSPNLLKQCRAQRALIQMPPKSRKRA